MDVDDLRHFKNEFFSGHESPLTPEQRAHFTGLRYFDIEPGMRFEAVLERPATSEYEDIQTSDGQMQHLPRAGTLRFAIDAKPIGLVAYEQGHDLFIPFRDATSGKDTYGAGRYVEAEALGGGKYLLDFNRAYNPYCAYNDDWRCPLPPAENWLTVAIRAGEKSFH
jgi:uncharacterized protein (DUF1684 family)